MRLDITNTRLQRMEINEKVSEAGRRGVMEERRGGDGEGERRASFT